MLVVIAEHTIHDGEDHGGLFIAYMLGPSGLELLIDHDSGFRPDLASGVRDFEDRGAAIFGVGETFCIAFGLESVYHLCRSSPGQNQPIGNIGHTQRFFLDREVKQGLVVGEK